MKRIATLLAILTVTAVAGSALAESQTVNCTPNTSCWCTQGQAKQPESFKDFIDRTEQMVP